MKGVVCMDDELYYPFYSLPYEYWAPVPTNLEELPNIRSGYFVSTFGRLVSTVRGGIPKLLAMQQSGGGYIGFEFATHDPNKKIMKGIHRVEMLVFRYIPNSLEMEVNHINGIKTYNLIHNLEWVTPGDNMRHAYRTGLHKPQAGEINYAAQITSEQADMIGRLLAERKYTHKQIAEIVGCSKNIVTNIRSGKGWKWVSEKYHLDSIEPRVFSNQNPDRLRFNELEVRTMCQYMRDNGITSKDIHGIINKDINEKILNQIGREYSYADYRSIYAISIGQAYKGIAAEYGF